MLKLIEAYVWDKRESQSNLGRHSDLHIKLNKLCTCVCVCVYICVRFCVLVCVYVCVPEETGDPTPTICFCHRPVTNRYK